MAASSGTARADSDVDVALLAESAADVEALRDALLAMEAELSVACSRPVHLVLLNDASAVLGHQIFSAGDSLTLRSPRAVARCLERVLVDYADGAYGRRLMEEALELRLASRG